MAECRNGYIYRNGKCSKRSNNPFKMWQSYVGAVVGLIYSFIIWFMYVSGGYLSNIQNNFFGKSFIWFGNLFFETGGMRFWVSGIFFIILGFLLGYVLTILYRRVRK